MDSATQFAVVLLVVIAFILVRRFIARTSVPTVTTTQLATRLAENPRAILLDVRESHEYSAGHVPQAVSVPLSGLDQARLPFGVDDEVYVICQSGNRSRVATKELAARGFSRVSNVAGGTSAWRGPLAR